MKSNNFFNKIYLSITSKAFYTIIIHERFAKSFFYLVVLSFLISLPASITSGMNYNRFSNSVQDVIQSKEFPSLYLKEGKLEIDSDEPYIYEENNLKSFKIIIDNTGQYTFNDLAGYYGGFLITTNHIIQTQSTMMPKTINYDLFSGVVLTNETLIDLIKTTQSWISYGVGAFSIVFTILGVFMKSLLAYFMVNFFRKALGIVLTAGQTYRIGIYSMTGPLIMIAILQLIPSFIPASFHFGIFIFVNLMYIINILKHFMTLKTDVSA